MDFQKNSMDIITHASEAKYYCFQAIRLYKEKKYELVHEQLLKAEEELAEGSAAHLEILQNEASTGEKDYSLLLIHAEDLLLTTSMLKDFLQEFLIN